MTDPTLLGLGMATASLIGALVGMLSAVVLVFGAYFLIRTTLHLMKIGKAVSYVLKMRQRGVDIEGLVTQLTQLQKMRVSMDLPSVQVRVEAPQNTPPSEST